MEDWTGQLAQALDRGFILTIDYGQLATDLYAPQNNQGTLVCYHRHVVSSDPYQHIGHQDMTCQVDFTSLMRLGDRHGLATVGYALQRQFLTNLGFSSCLEALQTQGLSAARTALSRMAIALVDPEDGDFKVLAQAKGPGLGVASWDLRTRKRSGQYICATRLDPGTARRTSASRFFHRIACTNYCTNYFPPRQTGSVFAVRSTSSRTCST